MNTKTVVQHAAGAALLLSGLAVAGSAYACPDCPVGMVPFTPAAVEAGWNGVANVWCPNGKVCGQGVGSGTSMAAVVANQANFGGLNGTAASACTDAYAYASDHISLLGFVEETNFGSSVIAAVKSGAAVLDVNFQACVQ
jgi:hypothetical protein